MITRVGLAPVVTSALLTLTRFNGVTNARRFIDVVAIVQILLFTVPLILLGRLICYPARPPCPRERGYDLEDTLIVGTGPVGVEVAEALERQPGVRAGAVRLRRPLRRRA